MDPQYLDRLNPKYLIWVAAAVFVAVTVPWSIYQECRIDVPNKHMAILTHKMGKDLEPGVVIAPSPEYKGVQKEVLTEGRYYYNPYDWEWQVVPQVEIPEGKLGVRIRMYGDDLAAGELIAWKENQKGIVPEVLRPGRYPINAWVDRQRERLVQNYAEIVELHDPVTIPAGYKGLITDLTAPMPKQANELLSAKGERGVQSETLEPGTYYLNPVRAGGPFGGLPQPAIQPHRHRVSHQGRFLGQPGGDHRIPRQTRTGRQPPTFSTTRSAKSKNLAEEVIAKVILPNARAYTRLRGSNHSGKEFIAGDTRVTFQEDFQKTMKSTCDEQGIEVIQALITTIKPPEKIADPVRRRQIALQQEAQYKKEIEQQVAEQELAVQKATVEQKKALVAASQEVVVVTTEAKKKQEVALIDANKRLAVAEQKLLAAKDLAAAIMAKGKADADVIRFANQAEAAGWQKVDRRFRRQRQRVRPLDALQEVGPGLPQHDGQHREQPADGRVQDVRFQAADRRRRPVTAGSPKN